MAYSIVQFDGVDLPDGIIGGDRQNMGTGDALTGFQQLPGGTFFDQYGTARSPQGIRPLSKSGVLHALTHAALLAELDALRGKLGVRGKLTIALDNGVRRWQWARLTVVDVPRTDDAKGLWVPYSLTWISAAQHWNEIIQRPQGWTVGDPEVLIGDGTAEVGISGTLTTLTSGLPQTISLTHDGNIPATNLRITLTPGASTITSFVVNNSTTDEQITHTGNVANGQSLVLDTGASSAKLYGARISIDTLTNSHGSIRIKSASAHGLTTGERVLLESLGAYNGEWKVSVVDADEFDITTSIFAVESVALAKMRRITNRYTNLNLSSRAQWLTLAAGANSVTITASGNSSGDATVGFYFYEHYA